LFNVLDEPASMDGPPVDRLRHVLRRTVDILVDQQPAVALLLRGRPQAPETDVAFERRREFDRRVTELIAEAARAGELRQDLDAALLARLAMGTISSIAEWYRRGARLGDAEIADTLDRFLLAGLRG
jgi:AcrR family transcriptional regulator